MSIIEKLGITPGPWEVKDPNIEWGLSDSLYVASKEKHKHVEMLYMNIDGALADQRANARLIAAAPEMLEALIESVIFIEDVSEGLDIANLKHYQNKINAVEKATGLSWEEVKKLTEKQAARE